MSPTKGGPRADAVAEGPADLARRTALDVLYRVSTQGAYAGAALRNLLPPELSAADRGLATEIVYGVLRRRGHLDRALKKAAGRRLKDLDPRLHDVLRLGAYQVMYLDRVPDYAAVHGAVELAKARGGTVLSKRANQVLRKLSDTPVSKRTPAPPAAEQDPVAHLSAVGSVRADVAAVILDSLGLDTARAFLEASLAPAPHVLRVNRLRATPADLGVELGAGPGAVPYALRLPEGLRQLPGQLPAVEDGRASPQDEASMRVVELLKPQPGETVLDVCAAPGGKTCHMAERMGDRGRVIAHDRHPDRLARVGQNAQRLGLRSIEISEVLPLESEPVDAVLVDAPCSGLGTLRRHPEIRWRFGREDMDALNTVQRKVLLQGAARVRPGGRLVYSVCTVTQQEGRALVTDILATLTDFKLEDELLTGPQDPGAPDGFYAARLARANKLG